MKTLLILGAGKEQVAAIAAAKDRRIRTVVLDMNPRAEGASLADEFHTVSTRDRDAVLKFLVGYPAKIDGVMTIASDIPHMVSAAAAAVGARHIPQDVAEICVHKLNMKATTLSLMEAIARFSPTGSPLCSKFPLEAR